MGDEFVNIMNFEWDENKRVSNIKKHKLDFADALYVFQDIKSVSIFDDREDYGEERYIIIGMDNKSSVCFVSYTIRYENTARILSFRAATKKEKEIYYGN
ncbi:MAG: BrnT family toxin [Elusimicrobiota bacterium]|jgi:uncharacterized DUF497 family protein|nr:BrnT family toxin [Elusimicrobiota bacterium]